MVDHLALGVEDLDVGRLRDVAPQDLTVPFCADWIIEPKSCRGFWNAPPDCAAIVNRWFGNDGPSADAKKLSART